MLPPWSPHRGRRGKTSASGVPGSTSARADSASLGRAVGRRRSSARARRSRHGLRRRAFRSELLLAKRLRRAIRPGDRRAGVVVAAAWRRRRSTTGRGDGSASSGPSGSRAPRTSAIEALTRFVPLARTSRAARRARRTYALTSLHRCVPEASIDADDPCERWLDQSMQIAGLAEPGRCSRSSTRELGRRRQRAAALAGDGEPVPQDRPGVRATGRRARHPRSGPVAADTARAGGSARRPASARPVDVRLLPEPATMRSAPSTRSSPINPAAGRTRS